MERLDLIAKNRRRLIRRREQLLRAYSNEVSNLGRDEDMESLDDEQYFQTAACESKELRGIDAALRRIREGVYGECEDCGDAIAERRLKALPLAKLCISCAKSSEFAHRNPLFV